MKLLIGVIIVLFAAAGLSLALMDEPGYVLVGYGQWTMETSVAVAVILLLVLFLLLHYTLRTIAGLRGMPRRFRMWRAIKRGERARRFLAKGLVELAEGQWSAAEKHLLRYAGDSDTKLLNYLGAARAAQQRGDLERRDIYLQHAHNSMPEADVAVGLTQAELQMAQHQYEQALATAMHLQQVAPRHTHVLKLLAKLYREVRDWERLNDLLPDLQRRHVFEGEELLRLRREVAGERLALAAREGDVQRLREVWRQTPADLRQEPDLVLAYARHLIALGEETTAERLLADALDSRWDERLVALYGEVAGPDPARQLAHAETWLRTHPHQSVLLYTLARLALRNQLWGKARSYLESSIGAGPSVAAYRDLGALLERMGESEAALRCYRDGLRLATGGELALPAPESAASPITNGDRSGEKADRLPAADAPQAAAK
ncbi:MAG: heme biosynthesis HemY N-terminal domain-containing protein [Gammaproteobacteria bacterium]